MILLHETYWTITTDPNHIGAEITWDIILELAQFLLVFIIGRPLLRWYKRMVIAEHDLQFHPNHKEIVDDES